jgi:hypothetical protein
MKTDTATALGTYLQGNVDVPKNLEEIRESYRAGKPFPNVSIDNLFSSALLERVLAEAPTLAPEQWLRFEQDGLEKTSRMRSALEVGPAGSQLVSVLHSAAFLYLLSEITGIWQLLPDPYLQGAGHARMRRGDYFGVHADRSIAYDTGLVRRLAMIVFLNKDWPADYGGCLELWNREGTQPEVFIEPLFNRTVIFEVAFPNYHGVPQPLTCPPARTRHSFITYFHTAGVDARNQITPHSSKFAPHFYRKQKSVLRSAAEMITPPFLRSALRRLIERVRS